MTRCVLPATIALALPVMHATQVEKPALFINRSKLPRRGDPAAQNPFQDHLR